MNDYINRFPSSCEIHLLLENGDIIFYCNLAQFLKVINIETLISHSVRVKCVCFVSDLCILVLIPIPEDCAFPKEKLSFTVHPCNAVFHI